MTQAIGLALVIAGVVMVYSGATNQSPSELVTSAFSRDGGDREPVAPRTGGSGQGARIGNALLGYRPS